MNDNTAPQGRFRFSGKMEAKFRLTGASSLWGELQDVGRFSAISHTWTDALEQLVAALDTTNAKYYFELKEVEEL